MMILGSAKNCYERLSQASGAPNKAAPNVSTRITPKPKIVSCIRLHGLLLLPACNHVYDPTPLPTLTITGLYVSSKYFTTDLNIPRKVSNLLSPMILCSWM